MDGPLHRREGKGGTGRRGLGGWDWQELGKINEQGMRRSPQE